MGPEILKAIVVLILVSKFRTKLEIITLGTNKKKAVCSSSPFREPTKYIPIKMNINPIFRKFIADVSCHLQQYFCSCYISRSSLFLF
jgi:hypothetical protein